MADEDVWDSIDRLYEWLDGDGDGDGTGDAGRPDDGRPRSGREELLLRILKLSEEVGEVAQAVIGATGQNPRKGTTHTWDDVRSELCDVVITGLVALRTLAPDAREVFTAHLAGVTERSLGTGRGPGRPG
ncbi:MazG-like family protein [Streptomyces sp. NPDC003483]